MYTNEVMEQTEFVLEYLVKYSILSIFYCFTMVMYKFVQCGILQNSLRISNNLIEIIPFVLLGPRTTLHASLADHHLIIFDECLS